LDWIRDVDWFLASLARTAGLGDQAGSDFKIVGTDPRGGGIRLFRHRATHLFAKEPSAVIFTPLTQDEIDSVRYETLSLSFRWSKTKITIKAVLHREYLALTFIAECSADAGAAQSASSDIGRCLDAAGDKMCELWGRIQDGKAPHSANRLGPEYAAEVLGFNEFANLAFNGFWDRFDATFIGPAFQPDIRSPHKASRGPILAGRIGAVFADFRGLVLSAGIVDGERTEIRLRTPTQQMPKSAQAIHTLGPEGDHKLVEMVLPFLDGAEELSADVAEQLPEATLSPSPEYAASWLLNRRALHVTSIGGRRIDRAAQSPQAVDPFRYLLLVDDRHRWELGRLLERLHLTGTVRLASLKDLRWLMKADTMIRSLEDRIRNEESGVAPIKDEFIEDLAGLYASRNHIEEAFDRGLLNRVGQSRYYVSNYLRETKALHIDAIDGFQTYEELVQRRLGATWNLIDGVGARFESLGRRLDSLNSAVRTDQLGTQTKKQTQLLSFAEVVASVPVGYYGAYGLVWLFSLYGGRLPSWLGTIQPSAPSSINVASAHAGESNVPGATMAIAAILAVSIYFVIMILLRPAFERIGTQLESWRRKMVRRSRVTRAWLANGFHLGARRSS
jgi:hypothetical protein